MTKNSTSRLSMHTVPKEKIQSVESKQKDMHVNQTHTPLWKSSRICRTVTPAWLVYTQVGFTVASSLIAAGLVLNTRNRYWIPAFVLLAAATITGAHADTSLRIWLNTGKCEDAHVRAVLLFHETFTALVILFWLALCIWLALKYTKTQK